MKTTICMFVKLIFQILNGQLAVTSDNTRNNYDIHNIAANVHFFGARVRIFRPSLNFFQSPFELLPCNDTTSSVRLFSLT